jgi:hypothetical protein
MPVTAAGAIDRAEKPADAQGPAWDHIHDGVLLWDEIQDGQKAWADLQTQKVS